MNGIEIKPDVGAFGSYNITDNDSYGNGETVALNGAALAQAEAKWYGAKFDKQGFKWALGQANAPGTSGTQLIGRAILSWNSPIDGAIVYRLIIPDADRARVIRRLREKAHSMNMEIDPDGSFFNMEQRYYEMTLRMEGGGMKSEVWPFAAAATIWVGATVGLGGISAAGSESAVESGVIDTTLPMGEIFEVPAGELVY